MIPQNTPAEAIRSPGQTEAILFDSSRIFVILNGEEGRPPLGRPRREGSVLKRERRYRGNRKAGSFPIAATSGTPESRLVPTKPQNGSFRPAFALRRQTLTGLQDDIPGADSME